MKTNLIRIGNSRGIRIPKPFIEQCGLGETVELRVARLPDFVAYVNTVKIKVAPAKCERDLSGVSRS